MTEDKALEELERIEATKWARFLYHLFKEHKSKQAQEER